MMNSFSLPGFCRVWNIRHLIAAVSAITCISGQSNASAADVLPTPQGSLKVLFAVPLTGDYAEIGYDALHGAQLASAYINDHGGVPSGPLKGAKITLEPVDDQMSAKAATTIGSQYLSDENVWTLAGFFSSGVAIAAAQVAARAKLSVFVTFAAAGYLTDKPPHNMLVMLPRSESYVRAALAFAVDQLHAKSIGVLGGDYSFLTSGYSAAEDEAKARGVSFVKQIYPTGAGGAQDFSPYLTTLAHSRVDVILCGSLEGDAGRLIKQARQLGLKQTFIDITGAGYHQTFSKVAGDAGIGAISGDSAALYASTGSLADQMQRAYQQKFKRQMNGPALYGFDTVEAIAAVTSVGTTRRSDLLTNASKARANGVQGVVGFTPNFRPLESSLAFVKLTGQKQEDREVLAIYKLFGNGSAKFVR